MGFFGLFGGRRLGKTVAEKRVENASSVVSVANRIRKLQARVVWLESNAPYEKNNRKRKQMEIDKLRIEREIERLERKHHALAARSRG